MHQRFKFFVAFSLLICFLSSPGYAREVPAPLINPLGDMSAYASVEYVQNTSTVFLIPVKDAIRSEEVIGDIWVLRHDGGGAQAAYRRRLKAYAESIGASVLRWEPEVAVFRKDAGNGEVWWCRAGFEGGMDLTIVKTLRLDAGRSMTFALGAGGRAEVNFHTVNPGGKFRSLAVTVPEGEISVYSRQTLSSGAYKRTIKGQWYLDSGRARRFILDTIPQEAGTCTFNFAVNSSDVATTVVVELTEFPYPVPKVAMGEKLGALRIKNVPYGLAHIVTETPFGTISIEHPEFPNGSGFENGDVTPEGDAYFLMPAGLWPVEVAPLNKEKASALRANFIPVHAGKETVLDWPLAMTRVFGKDGGCGLEINTITQKDAEVEVIFSLHGREAESIIPKKESLTVKEGGAGARVLSVERTDIPLDIVLLLDSSGSMKGQMKNALAATRKFIGALPDDAIVRVVDFDTKPKLLAGTTKAEMLDGLAGVKANGATCLNDSVLKGLHMLGSARRPALLLFTDGFDANHNDTGPGSTATQKAVLAAVNAAGIPVFTIGFGKGHDRITLDRIAAMSGGRYYAAGDPKALADAFAVINANLNNTFTARYARPTRGRSSDVPVVTCMVDISGSMNTTPDKSGCDYRIDKVKTILHDFLTELPDGVLGQAMSFNDDVYIDQVTTASKAALLSGLNSLDAGGFTDTAEAVRSALETMAAIASSKRYLVFITDAALEADPEKAVLFDTLLAKLKDEGIYCLWVGIGALDEKPFTHAAALSGGSCILTESPDDLAKAFQTMLADIKTAAARTRDAATSVEVTLKHRAPSGRNLGFASAHQAVIPALRTDDSVAIPASIAYSVTDLNARYGADVADMVTGDGVPVRDAKISKRIPIRVTGRNAAASFTVKEAYFMSRLRGVDAPTGFRFLVLVTEMSNILAKQTVTVYPDGTQHPAAWVGNDAATTGRDVQMVPTYLIPDLKRHLFLRWNNESMTPISPATWLAEKPLVLPGENAVSIAPKTPVSGAMVFVVPEGHMKQMSLHFYDTAYGHAEIPLVGTMDTGLDRLSGLPAQPPVRLSDTFSLAVREVRDVEAVGKQPAGAGSVYRIVEADFVSNVQALLDIKPAERFFLRLNTREGALNVRLHGVTGFLPLGFLAPTMVSPGANNRIRLAFQIPKVVVAEAGMGELVVDVKGGAVVVPLDRQAAGAPVAQPPGNSIKGEGVDLVVNAIKRHADTEDMLVADLTLFDRKDGQATAMADAFILKKKNTRTKKAGNQTSLPDYGQSKGLAGFGAGNAIIPIGTMPPDSVTDDLIFGITDDTVIPDGGSLRGLVVFKLPYGDAEPGDWRLTSVLFPSLDRKLSTDAYAHKWLMVRRNPVERETGSAYLDGLSEAVARLKRQRDARRFERPGHYKPKVLDVNGDGPPTRNVPVPEATDPALADFAAIKNIQGLKKRLATVRYLPGNGAGWQYRFAPQAVLTQNWGSEGDLARMAEIILARQGIHTTRTELEVTDKGRERLAALAGLFETAVDKLPALVYHDARGDTHTLVAPFLAPITTLSGLVKRARTADDVSTDVQSATLTVSLLVKPKKGGRGTVDRDMSNALMGETDAGDAETIHLLSATPTLPELSRGAVDIGYTVVGYKSGPVIKAVFDGNDKRVIGSDTVDTGEYEVVGERIEISLESGSLVHAASLGKDESIVDRFHTLGVNLPDMGARAARTLDADMQKTHNSEDAPDNLSALKWYARNLVYRFVCAQTEYENDLAKQLDLVVGRTINSRCIIATVSRPSKDGRVITAIDLRQTANQVHPGSHAAMAAHRQAAAPPDQQAVHAFNIMSGLFASRLESRILPEGGMGFFEMMARLPKDTAMLWLTPDARYGMQDALKAGGMPDNVLALLAETPNVVLFPSVPAIIDGRPRWAWLEVNPNTYETIAVLDTGARGAMVERVFNDLWKDGLDYITGGLVGVS